VPFVIDKVAVPPQEVVGIPFGEVLYAAFDGDTAYLWLKIEIGEERTQGAIILPNGGPYDLQEMEGFCPAHHVGSFVKIGKVLINSKHTKPVTSAWHTFVWPPTSN